MADKYITRAELRLEPYLIKHEVVDNKYLETLQDLTYSALNNLCGQSFEPEGTSLAPVEKLVDGIGKGTIFLPATYPILRTVTKVRIYVSTSTYYDYGVENFYNTKYRVEWKQIQAEPRIIGTPGVFPLGQKNIGVFGLWGWETVPTPIKYLQGKMIKNLLENQTFVTQFQNFSVGDFSYSLRDQKAPITGDAELDSIIKQYRRPVIYATSGT